MAISSPILNCPTPIGAAVQSGYNSSNGSQRLFEGRWCLSPGLQWACSSLRQLFCWHTLENLCVRLHGQTKVRIQSGGHCLSWSRPNHLLPVLSSPRPKRAHYWQWYHLLPCSYMPSPPGADAKCLLVLAQHQRNDYTTSAKSALWHFYDISSTSVPLVPRGLGLGP